MTCPYYCKGSMHRVRFMCLCLSIGIHKQGYMLRQRDLHLWPSAVYMRTATLVAEMKAKNMINAIVWPLDSRRTFQAIQEGGIASDRIG